MTGLSIIIPTHRRLKSLIRLMNSLIQQDVDFKTIEVIIVSNFSDKALVKFCHNSHFPFKVILEVSQKLGVNFARNRGIDLAQYDYLLFLDDDVELMDKSYLQQLLGLSWSPLVGAIGGDYQLAPQAPLLDQCYHEIAMSWFSQHQNLSSEQCLLLGGNTLYHKKLLGDKLRFNEAIVFGGAETELNLRLISAGFKLIYNPQLSLFHHTSLNLYNFIKKAYLQGKGKKNSNDHKQIDVIHQRDESILKDIFKGIYKIFFFLGGVEKMPQYLFNSHVFNFLVWRVIPAPLAIIFLSISLFFPIPLIGISVVYIDFWDKFYIRTGLK